MLWLWTVKWITDWASLFFWGNRLTRTQSGTWLLEGIEYNELPAPIKLVKAMNRKWAEELRDHGSIRINHLDYFRKWENAVLGDQDEGQGRYTLQGQEIQTGTANEVYAWCASLPSITPERLNEFARQSGYDCLLVIHDPKALFEKIREGLRADGRYHKSWFHCGRVKYDKRYPISKARLNGQKFHFNLFQKDWHFSADNEYRLSITKCDFIRQRDKAANQQTDDEDCVKYIELSLGDCTKLVTIEALPPFPLEKG